MRGLLAVCFFVSAAALAATPEDRLSTVFQSIEANRLDEALQRVDALIREYPHFRLAHLVRGDLPPSFGPFLFRMMSPRTGSHPSGCPRARTPGVSVIS